MSANGTIRILLVDDHPALRRGLTTIIHDHCDMQVVAEADDGRGSDRAVQGASS